MHLFDQRSIGIVILVLLGMLVVVKQLATGSILDKPKGSLLIQIVNSFNLFFLLIVNPLAAILLVTRHIEVIDSFRIPIYGTWPLTFLEMAGLVFYPMGFLLMAWSLIKLGHNYQLGGSTPRFKDELVINGPYRVVRHPMYTAALIISLGLACLIQSWVLLGVFGSYLILILMLIPLEEDRMRQAYAEQYIPFRQRTKKLIPFVY